MKYVLKYICICILVVVLGLSCLWQAFAVMSTSHTYFLNTVSFSLSVFDAYEKIAELTIEDSIKNELSGDFERLMLAVGERGPPTQWHRTTAGCLINTLFHLIFFPHSPVHQECSHVLCQAPLQVNEGTRRLQSYGVWQSSFLNFALLFFDRFCESFPGTRYRWQHPDPDHDFPFWDRHAGHSRVFPSEIREVAL